MAAENFKVKKGLEVGTGTTINATGINVTGVVTATQLVGDGSGLTGVVGSGSGVVIKDEGSAVGTAGTINFVGSGVAATLSEGTATVTVGINTANIVTDTLNVSGISTFDGRVLIGTDTEGHPNADDLTIATSGDTGITIRSGTSHNGRIYFSDATSGTGEIVGSLDYDHNDNRFSIVTNGSEKLRIDSSGRLLLGTTTEGHPNADDFTVATSGDTGITIRSGTTNNGRIYFSDATSGTGEVVGSLDYDHNLDKFNIITNGELRFHINGDGNVGINSGLTVSGISTFTNEIVIRDDSPTITFDQTSGNLNTNQYRIKQASGELVVQVSHNNGASYTNGVSIGGIGNIFIPDNDKVFFGTNDDAYIQHDNSNLNVINTTGNIDVSGNVVLNNDLKVGTGATLAPNGNANFSGIITATSFSGLLVGNVQGNATSASSCSGNAATATEATKATNVTVTANNSTNETVYPVFVDGATGTQGAETDTGLNYNPSTGNLSATKFTGDGSGLTSIPSAQLNGALPALDGSALTNITGSGSGVIIRHDGNVVGTASSINFSTNLDVSAISAGIVTVTASGGSGISTANIVTDSLNVSGIATFNQNVIIPDNKKILFGTDDDLQIYHDTTYHHGFIKEIGSGGLIFATDVIEVYDANVSEKMITANQNSAVRLYYDSIQRFATSGIGATVYGQLDTTSGASITGVCTATTFSGSGASLTTLNASELDSGTIPNGRFPTTLPAVSGANLTNLPAANLSGTISDARISDIGDSEARIITFDNLEKSNLSSDGELGFDSSQGLLVYRSQQGTTGGVTVLDGANVDAGTGISITNLGTGSEGTTSFEFSIADNGVTFDKLEDVANNRILGRVSSGSGNAEELTATQVRTLLNVADGATAGITTAASNVQVTWSVGANGSSAYRFTGPGNDGSDDNPDLYLVRGQRYRFINNSGGSHPFEIRSSAGGSAYSTGVTNNGASSGNIDFNVQHDAPTRLYYQCTSHGGMVGNIYITGGASWQTTDVNTSTTEEIFTNLNVGIGTDNPNTKLHVTTTSSSAIPITVQRVHNNNVIVEYKNNTSSMYAGLAGNALGWGVGNSVDLGNSSNNKFIVRRDTGNIGVGVLNPEQKLDVDGTIRFGTSNISSGTYTFTASAGSAVTADSTAVGNATAIEYTIFISNGSNIQSQKVLIMDNGTTAYSQEFAMMANPNMIATFSADVNSGNVRLRATPETGISGSTTIKFSKLIIE